MPTLSKRTKIARNLIIKPAYSLDESIKLLKQTATTKFIESAEAHFCLNLDTKYSDQQLRTTITLPRGTGKEVKIFFVNPTRKRSSSRPIYNELFQDDFKLDSTTYNEFINWLN